MSYADVDLDRILSHAHNRLQLWGGFLNAIQARSAAEIGVWRGEFAEAMLHFCPALQRYYMVDPWRHLQDWNKPANTSDAEFEKVKAEALRRTEFASERRIVVQGRSLDVLDRIPDGSLDFAYIDSDHSLRGITIDLQRILPKMHPNGWIGGDDFVPNVWQHSPKYEPSFVFPYAVYFAEAIGAPIYAIGHSQFLISMSPVSSAHSNFIDRTGIYQSTAVADALRCPGSWRFAARTMMRRGKELAARARGLPEQTTTP